MIGRGAVRDPWVFRRIEHALAGRPAPIVDMAERERLLLSFYATIRDAFASENGALGRMKKIARYFGDGVEGGDDLRQAIFHARSTEEVFDVVRSFFAERRAAA
jgi:tRNA-dihydrouridine synthase